MKVLLVSIMGVMILTLLFALWGLLADSKSFKFALIARVLLSFALLGTLMLAYSEGVMEISPQIQFL